MQIKRIQWDFDAWEEYCQWQQTNKAVLKRINALIKDIRRSPFEGIGKPEPLKENLSGFWSRRINDKHRIIYAVEKETVSDYRVQGTLQLEDDKRCAMC